MATSRDVAEWMLDQFNRSGELYQDDAVYGIESKFGREFTHENEYGNVAIDRNVLKEFRKLTGDDVVWERRERFWRKREQDDEPGRLQN